MKFVEEIKKQGKPYGLYFEDIQGGFTLTQRTLPQAFQVIPVMVWRVYADGRPDELVRGVDIVGTPLLSLNNIILTGDKLQVFNGVCGAESGQVPVSAAAPAMLFSEIEVQKKGKGTDRPPLMPPPGLESARSWGEAMSTIRENRATRASGIGALAAIDSARGRRVLCHSSARARAKTKKRCPRRRPRLLWIQCS